MGARSATVPTSCCGPVHAEGTGGEQPAATGSSFSSLHPRNPSSVLHSALQSMLQCVACAQTTQSGCG